MDHFDPSPFSRSRFFIINMPELMHPSSRRDSCPPTRYVPVLQTACNQAVRHNNRARPDFITIKRPRMPKARLLDGVGPDGGPYYYVNVLKDAPTRARGACVPGHGPSAARRVVLGREEGRGTPRGRPQYWTFELLLPEINECAYS